MKCSEEAPEEHKPKETLEILEVKCMTKPDPKGYPLRSKCWKISVPNKFREYITKDEGFPWGWGHRKFFNGKGRKSVVPPLHPTLAKKPHLETDMDEGSVIQA